MNAAVEADIKPEQPEQQFNYIIASASPGCSWTLLGGESQLKWKDWEEYLNQEEITTW